MFRVIARFAALGFALIFIFALCLTACAGTEKKVTGNIEDKDDQEHLNIVTSFFPVYVATINIAKDVPGVSIINMTEPQTGCLHDYALRPADLKLLEKADIFVVNGAGMESFIEDVINQHEGLKVIEASEGIDLLEDENGEANPHVWVSITNAITYVNNIADQLSAADSTNKDQYSANAAAYVQKLEDLKNEMHNVLDGLKNRDIITFHEAFPYFALEFNLNIAAVVEREPGSEPTPRELAEVIDIIRQTGIKSLFTEPQYSVKAAEAIARDTGAKVYTLDPVVTGEAVPGSADAYIVSMRKNMETLVKALGDQ